MVALTDQYSAGGDVGTGAMSLAAGQPNGLSPAFANQLAQQLMAAAPGGAPMGKKFANQLPGPLSLLNVGANTIGGLLSHLPGLGGIAGGMKPGASNLGAIKTALGGGLEAGGAALGIGALAGAPAAASAAGGLGPLLAGEAGSFSLGGLLGGEGAAAAGGAGVLTAAEEAEAATASGILGRSVAADLPGTGSKVAGAIGNVAKGVLGSKLGKLAIGVGGVFGASKLFGLVSHPSGNAASPTKVDPSDLQAALAAQGINLSAAEVASRQKALAGFQELGYQNAAQMAFPELKAKADQEAAAHQKLVMQQMTGFLNPYVQQVRTAAAQQAQILRGLLPSVSAKYRPMLSAFIGEEQQASDAGAASSALSSLVGGVGLPSTPTVAAGSSGSSSALDALVSQYANTPAPAGG